MWSNFTKSVQKSLTDTLEKTGEVLDKTGDAITKGVTQQLHNASKRDNAGSSSGSNVFHPSGSRRVGQEEEEVVTEEQQPEVLMNLQKGWSTMVERTKSTVQKAQEVVEREQSRIQQEIVRRSYLNKRRDLKFPLDARALKDAQVVYITDRIITMSHPAMASPTQKDITGDRKLAAVSHMLHKRHGDTKYMVWNLSEMDYDTTLFNDNVLTFSFPGSPAPSLGLWLKLLISMESWMRADESNIAVVHCLTGKGRTSTILASFLCWIGQAQFHNLHDALEYIAMCKHTPLEELTIPSQRRYASYFGNMLDGVRPNQPPLVIKRILMSSAPRFAKGPPRDDSNYRKDASMGCIPYMQIFKAGTLVFTTAASLSYKDSESSDNDSASNNNDNNNNANRTRTKKLPFCQVADGTITFHVDQVVQGDILLRCRHWNPKNKKKVSIFRAAFHTGYCPSKIFRLTKTQLDGACNDPRFPDDFYVDILLEPCDAEKATAASSSSSDNKNKTKTTTDNDDNNNNKNNKNDDSENDVDRTQVVVTASEDDAMLHRESRFWDVIAQQKQKQKDNAAQEDPMYGATIGRRRNFPNTSQNKKQQSQKAALETFSIGGELDFLPEDPSPASSTPTIPPETPATPTAPASKSSRNKKNDSLMEALMAIEEDDEKNTHGVEEIVFHTGSEEQDKQPQSNPKLTATSATATATTTPKTQDTTATSNKPEVTKMTTLIAAKDDHPTEKDNSNQGATATTKQAKDVTTTDTLATTVATPDGQPLQSQEITATTKTQQESSDLEQMLTADLDPDMDKLLASSSSLENLDDAQLEDLDFDDAELEDLENFLTK